jgi:hypothetical protein
MMKKKMITMLLTLTITLGIGATVLAATYGSSASGVRNTERWHQLSYFGEAWTTRRGQTAQINYYRSGRHIGSATAHLDSWRTSGRAYNNVTIWDSLNPRAPKTTFTYRY